MKPLMVPKGASSVANLRQRKRLEASHIHLTNSISPGRQVLLNHVSSGP